MPQVRTFPLVIICFLLASFTLAIADQTLEGIASFTPNDPALMVDDAAYYKYVILPAIRAGTLTPEQKMFLLRRDARYRAEMPNRDERGGPDEFGHRWRDVDEPLVEFEWFDITEVGEQMENLGDDWNSGALELGWTFPFYGNEFTELYICSNGFVSLSSDATDYESLDLPNGDAPENLLAPHWTDLNPNDGGEIWFFTGQDEEERGVAVVSWIGISPYGVNGENPQTFQVAIREDGAIMFQYADDNPAGDWVTVGIQNGDRDDGLSIIRTDNDGEFIYDGYAIAIMPSWIQDPDNPVIVYEPDAVDFGDVYVDDEPSVMVTIDNVGGQDLTVDAITCEENAFVVPRIREEEPWVIGPEENATFDITFAPADEGDFESVVVIHSDAANADEDGNVYISVVASANVARPVITVEVDPDPLDFELSTGEMDMGTLTIGNDGDLALEFEVAVEVIEAERDQLRRSLRTTGSGTPNRDWESDMDGFGYYAKDSEEPEVDYEWLDITDGDAFEGTQRLNPGDDWNSGALNLGWTFMWYDQEVNSVRVCSNGWMTLNANEGSIQYPLPQFPNAAAPNALLSPIGCDLNPSAGGSMWFWTNGEDMAVASWIDVPRYGNNAIVQTFQIILTADGMVKYQWARLENVNFQGDISVGWENWNGNDGMNIYYHGNGHQPEVEMAIGIATDFTSWVSVDPADGVIDVEGDPMELSVIINAFALEAGEYNAVLHVMSNDPENDQIDIDVSLAVEEAPDIDVVWDEGFGYPDEANWNQAYEDLFNDTPYDMSFMISNLGVIDLDVDDITFEGDQVWSVEAGDLDPIEPDGMYELVVTLQTEEAGAYEAVMTISSDDPDEGDYEIVLVGETFSPPIITIEPDGIDEQMLVGAIDDHDVTLGNAGDAPLTWYVEIEEIEQEEERDALHRGLRRTGGSFAQPAEIVPSNSQIWGTLDANRIIEEYQRLNPVRQPVGPRRDQPEALFAFFNDGYDGWGNYNAIWDQAEANVDVYRSDAFDDAPIDDYDCVWIREYQQDAFNSAWNENVARFEEWVDAGGVIYHCSGTNYWAVAPRHVGGIVRIQSGSGNGQVAITNDPDADNYNYFAELNGWEGGEILNGSSWSHASYSAQALEDIENSDWYQVIAHGQGNEANIGVAIYNYGGGFSMISGTTDSHQYNNYRQEGQWGAALVNIIWYMDYLSQMTGGWLAVTPEEGELEGNSETNVVVTLDATGLEAQVYEAIVHFMSNDPQTSDLEFPVAIEIIGGPDIFVEWAEEYGYPDVMNWNNAYADLFTGGPYDMSVEVTNLGTEALTVEEIGFDIGAWTADPEAFELAVDETQIVTVTFEVAEDAPDEYLGTMTFFSDDEDEGEYDVELYANAMTPPDIHVTPAQIEQDHYTGGMSEHALEVSNVGDADLRFMIEVEEIEQEEERDQNVRALRHTKADARRDDPGDLIAQFQGPNVANRYCSPSGWDWDNEWMWFTKYSDNWAGVWTTDDDYGNPEQVFQIAPGNCMDGAWARGVYFTATLGNQTMQRFDSEGNALQAQNTGVSAYGIAADHENGWLFVQETGNNYAIHVFELDNDGNIGDQIGICNNHLQFANNQAGYNLEWVPAHIGNGGPLWYWSYNQGLFQIDMDTDEWVAIENEERVVIPVNVIQFNQYYDAVAHDGENLWAAGYAPGNVRIYDDGIVELQWILVEPEEGELAADEAMDVMVYLDATNLYGGLYEAIIHFLTNDPDERDLEIPVTMAVEGAPDINAVWDDEYGYPDVLDWNMFYADVFSGGPYDMVIEVENAGTDVLQVDAVYDELDGVFVADPDGFELDPEESIEMTITFEVPAEEPDEYYSALIFETNDPDEEFYEIQLRAEAFLPPEIRVTPGEVTDELYTGEKSEHALDVENNGDADLNFMIEIVPIEDEERDAGSRTLRNTSEASLRRDDAGDLLGEFAAMNAANRYCSPAGYDWDNERMWMTSYTLSQAIAYTFDDDYEEVEAVLQINPGSCMQGAWARGVYYTSTLGNTQMQRWDSEGQQMQAAQLNHNIYGVAADHFNGWLFAMESGNNYAIHVYELDDDGVVGQQIGVINNHMPYHQNVYGYNCEWVPAHIEEGGALWINVYSTQSVYQVNVDIEEWTCIDNDDAIVFRTNCQTTYDGVAHDKFNMWAAGYTPATTRVYDDGIDESYANWIYADMEMGTVGGGDAIEVIITLDAFGMSEGEYEADINFYSNDPANPTVTIPATLTVFNASDLRVKWHRSLGEGFLDFNAFYGDQLFHGGPYELVVEVENTGTDILEIADISCDIDEFSADPAEMEVAVDEKAPLTIIFWSDSDQANEEFVGTFTLENNSVVNEFYEFEVRAIANNPPVLDWEADWDLEEWIDDIVSGQQEQHTIRIWNAANEGDANLLWEADLEEIFVPDPRDEERDAESRTLRRTNADARRDDPGDIIATFQGPNQANSYCSPSGWDWDNERMWFTNYNIQSTTCWTVDNNYENPEQVLQVAAGSCMDGAWARGVYFTANLGNTSMQRFDSEGNALQAQNTNVSAYGIAADNENGWLFVQETGNNYAIHVFELDNDGNIGDQIGIINNHQQFHNNQAGYNLEWVPAHIGHGGPLWYWAYNQGLFQIDIDTDEWQAVDNEDRIVLPVNIIQFNQYYDAVAHDGHNLWAAGYQRADVRIYDDGIAESYWIGIDPTEGDVAPGAEQDPPLTIYLDGSQLFTGVHEAMLYLTTNDPHPDRAYVEIPINCNVTGTPDIEAEWEIMVEENLTLVDWNLYYDPNLFSGGLPEAYPIVITVINNGTDDLQIDEISANTEHFWSVPDGDEDPIIIAPLSETTVTFYFQADDPDEYEGRMTFFSNDPDEEDSFVLDLHANAESPPGIVIDPPGGDDFPDNADDAEDNGGIYFDLLEAEEDDFVFNITNAGQAELYWSLDVEDLGRQGEERDATSRTLRRTSNRVPERDEPGDILHSFQLPRAASQAPTYARNWDTGMMMLSTYQGFIDVYDPEDYELIETVAPGIGSQTDCAWIDGVFYVNVAGTNRCVMFDNDLERLGEMALPFSPSYGLSSDPDNGWFFAKENTNAYPIHVYEAPVDGELGEEIGVINNYGQFSNNQCPWTINWVGQHPEGELWVHTPSGGGIMSIDIDIDDDWTPVAQTYRWADPGNNGNWLNGVGHDGVNVWVAINSNATCWIMDDGIQEKPPWIEVDPTEGTLGAEGEQDVLISINTEGLLGGRYHVIFNIFHNDPGEVNPYPYYMTVDVTGVPHIYVEPGGPELDDEDQYMNPPADWGVAYFGWDENDELITYPKPMRLWVENVGTDDLQIDAIYASEGFEDFFWIDEDQLPIILGVNDRDNDDYYTELEVWFAPDEIQEYETTLLFESNDPFYQEEPYPVRVQGIGLEAPVLVWEPEFFEAIELGPAEIHEEELQIYNEGGSELTWTIEVVTDFEEARDDRPAQRMLRSTASEAAWEAPTNVIPSDDPVWGTPEGIRMAAEASLSRQPNRAAGPRRDQPESIYAYFKEADGWGAGMDGIFDQVEAQMDQYGSGDFADFPIEDYDCIWIREYQSDNFNNQWNENRERFEEWVDHGGAIYHGTGTNNWNVVPIHVGGLQRQQRGDSNGQVAISNDPNAENYNYYAELVGWEGGEILNGSSWSHASYTANDLENVENSDYYQVIAHGQNNEASIGVVVYNYGSGWCVATGTTDSHQYQNFGGDGQWGGSLDEMVLYLDYLSGYSEWISVEPEEGTINVDDGAVVILTLNSEGQEAGDYYAELWLRSNDPAPGRPNDSYNSEFVDGVIPVEVTVMAQPYIFSTPPIWPFDEAEGFIAEIEFPNTYVDTEARFPITIENIGNSDLELTEVVGNDEFWWDIPVDQGVVIEPFGSARFDVVFMPGDVGQRGGEDNDVVGVYSNGENAEDGYIWVDVSGIGEIMPEIDLGLGDGGEYVGDEMWIHQQNYVNEDPWPYVFTISNPPGDFRRTLEWRIKLAEADPPDQQRDARSRSLRRTTSTNVLRDDPGDIIAQFQGPNAANDYCSPAGWDFDNERMWITNYYGQATVWTVENNYENPERVLQVNAVNCMDGAWARGIYYTASLGNATMQRYDSEGGALQSQNTNVSAYGIAADDENGWLFIQETGNNYAIHVFELDEEGNIGDQIGIINNHLQFHNNQAGYNLEWVTTHIGNGGPLWYYAYNQGLFQIDIDTEEWVAVDNDESITIANNVIGFNQYYDAVAHDGENLWAGGYQNANIRIYDDGVAELSWVDVDDETKEGTTPEGEVSEVILWYNTYELEEGMTYYADMTIETNIPGMEEVIVKLDMTTGVPPWDGHWDFEQTGTQHDIVIMNATMDGMPMETGWDIGVFTPDGVCAGGTVWNNVQDEVILVAYGADQDHDYFSEGERFSFMIWDRFAEVEYSADAEFPEMEVENNDQFFQGERSWANIIGFSMAEQTIHFGGGWDLFSLNVDPGEDYMDDGQYDVWLMIAQFGEGEESLIEIIKNEDGQFAVPSRGFSTIRDGWKLDEGYYARFVEEANVDGVWSGRTIPANQPFHIETGWNYIPFYPTYDLDAGSPDFYVVGGIVDQVVIARDDGGGFMVPEEDFSNMDPWAPGQAYQINVREDLDYSYPMDDDNNAALAVEGKSGQGHWTAPVRTDANMSVLINSVVGFVANEGDQIAAFNADGRIVGVGTFDSDGRAGIAVWGDDSFTELKDGMVNGDEFTLRVWDADRSEELIAESARPNVAMVYSKDDLLILDVAVSAMIPDVYYLAQNFPNPFNAVTKVAYGLPEAAEVSIRVYDLTGRLVATLVDGQMEAGHHVTVWNGRDVSAGVYLIRIETASFTKSMKSILMK